MGLQKLQGRCEQHDKKLKFYCKTDKSAICSRCLLHNHKGHDVIEQDKTYADKVWFVNYFPQSVEKLKSLGYIRRPSPNAIVKPASNLIGNTQFHLHTTWIVTTDVANLVRGP